MRGRTPNNETGHIEWETLPFNVACFSLFGCFPSSVPGCARSTFPVGEGDLPAGAFHTLSWERVAGPQALTGVGRHLVKSFYFQTA